MKLKVVNLFGGPGSGKSTAAYGLLHLMRLRRMNAEFASDVAKERAPGGSALDGRREIFEEQLRRIERWRGHAEWVVADSPLLACCVCEAAVMDEAFEKDVLEAHYSFLNQNFFLRRVAPPERPGELRNEAASELLGTKIRAFLRDRFIPVEAIAGDAAAPARILSELLE